MLVRVLHVHV